MTESEDKLKPQTTNRRSKLLDWLNWQKVVTVGIGGVLLLLLQGTIQGEAYDLWKDQLLPWFKGESSSARFSPILLAIGWGLLGLVAYNWYRQIRRSKSAWGIGATSDADPASTELNMPAQLSRARRAASIVELLTRRQSTQALRVALLIVCIMSAEVPFSWLTGSTIDWTIAIIGTGLLLLIAAQQIMLSYRIRRGYYGLNRAEALEIVTFMVQHSDSSDFTGGGGLRKVLADPEPDVKHTPNFSEMPGVRP